jgi:hypothetical protein
MIPVDQTDGELLERAYNWTEVVLWGVIAVVFAKRALSAAGKKRRLLAIVAAAFAAFSASDVIEVFTGSWWEPPWLLVLKVACVVTALLVWRAWHRSFGGVGAKSKSGAD